MNRRPQKYAFQILDVSFLGFRSPSRQGQGQDQERVRRRRAALQLKLALTLTLAIVAGGAKTRKIKYQGFENRVFGASESCRKN